MKNAALDFLWLCKEIASFGLIVSSVTLIVIACTIMLGA